MKRKVDMKTRILRRNHWFITLNGARVYPYYIKEGFDVKTIWINMELVGTDSQERPRKAFEEVKRMILAAKIKPLKMGDLIVTPHDGLDYPDIIACPTVICGSCKYTPPMVTCPDISTGDFVRSGNRYIDYYFTSCGTNEVRIEDISICYKEENDGKRVSMPL